MKKLMDSAKEVAELTGMSPRTVVRLCDSGRLPATKLGGKWFVNHAKLLVILGIEDAEEAGAND